MTLQELIESIYALNDELKKFEEKYGVASPDFYELFLQGKLDNGEYEDTEEFCMWAGVYETKLDREQKFRRLSQEYIATLEKSAEGRAVYLTPRAEPIEV